MRMPPKCATSSRKRSASSSLSPAPVPRDVAASGGDTLKKPRLSKTKANDHSHPIEEYQQVTKADFVETYKVDELEGGDCYYMPGMITKEESQKWYNALIDSKDWYQPTLKLYGRDIVQSRHIAAYSTVSSLPLKYSGTQINMVFPFPPAVEEMRKRVEEVLSVEEGGTNDDAENGADGKGKVRFNHCMMNRYENGSVYIGKHSDNIENKVIASVSLGAERTFILHPREPSKRSRARASAKSSEATTASVDKRKPVRFKLGDGSLFVMQGRTQEYWKHEIPKEPKIKKGRISLTFRQLVYE